MSLIKSFVLVLAALASVDALATHARSLANHHHALGRRLPQVMDTKVNVPMKKKRSLSRRCKVKSSASSTPVVGNVGSAPSTSSKETKPTKAATTTHKAALAPTTTTDEAPTTTKSSGSGGSGGNLPYYMTGVQTGDATYYATGLGACGITNKDSDYIVAVSHLLFDSYPGYNGGNPNDNPVCGKKIRASLHGKSVDVTVTDRCVGCLETDLDFSPAAFDQIGSVEVGREHGMQWVWI